VKQEDWPQPSPADLTALGALWNEHRPGLLAMVQRRLDRRLAARLDPEDVLSRAFLQAQRRWQRCKDKALQLPRAWLYGLVRDSLIEEWRTHHRGGRDLTRDQPWPEDTTAQLALRLIDSGTSPSEAAGRVELQQQMRRALEVLKEVDREILLMRHYDGLTYQEAAEVLGLSENAAMVRHARALQRLRKLWLQVHPGEGGGP
jgi:RNA polymerase sigma-70 factor (ECF subfamily)